MNTSSLMYWARLYKMLIAGSVRSRMQYKFNFILASVLAALIQISDFLMVAIVLNKFGAIKGWSIYEVGYLFAVMTLSKTIYRTFASDVHHLERYLVSGELDQLLIRPVPVLLALMSQNFRIMLGEVLQGGFVLGWAIYGLMKQGQVDWTVLPLSFLVILTGSVILFSIGLATATAGFWLTRITELQNITEDAARTAAQYPLVLYPNWLKSLLLFAIPVGFVNYVPSLYILKDRLGGWILAVVFIAAAVCLSLSLWFWRYGLSKYQSTGS